ncbi:DUF2484 family protein [Cognatishimia sp. F0-27]|uniref:DUF2484 family protein n=1 Tax=Cognatishimia sp. F0-27 TaxID=2816855 RepID=UPI001D0CBD33|nr:DUF2484 family protein [Cognatishimia sp. F0-27]MCC1492520.1 DUF2484 family protein [Cognatishimia sp. F0-27]
MSGSLIAGALWVLASTGVALLPIAAQYKPGVILLGLGPVLILWIGWEHGWIWAAVAATAFLSLYRNPLRFLWRRLRGKRPATSDRPGGQGPWHYR